MRMILRKKAPTKVRKMMAKIFAAFLQLFQVSLPVSDMSQNGLTAQEREPVCSTFTVDVEALRTCSIPRQTARPPAQERKEKPLTFATYQSNQDHAVAARMCLASTQLPADAKLSDTEGVRVTRIYLRPLRAA
jgi:hypothetical protein